MNSYNKSLYFTTRSVDIPVVFEGGGLKKITGHLEGKNGKWYAAVNHYGPDNKRHAKWYSLDVETKRGNRRRAEERLTELLEKPCQEGVRFAEQSGGKAHGTARQ